MNTEMEARNKLWSLIKDIRFAMFTTRSADGELHSRPMTTQNRQVDEDDRLWFFMSRRGHPVENLVEAAGVNVSYSDPDSDRYVSVSGIARVVDERSKKEAFWSALVEAWFPGGIDDPDLALVEVKITQAEFWDVKASKLTQLYKMAKAAVAGKPPVDLGETHTVRMQ